MSCALFFCGCGWLVFVWLVPGPWFTNWHALLGYTQHDGSDCSLSGDAIEETWSDHGITVIVHNVVYSNLFLIKLCDIPEVSNEQGYWLAVSLKMKNKNTSDISNGYFMFLSFSVKKAKLHGSRGKSLNSLAWCYVFECCPKLGPCGCVINMLAILTVGVMGRTPGVSVINATNKL